MNHKSALLAIVLIALSINATGRSRIDLNRGWTVELPYGSTDTVNLPHDFQIAQPWLAPADNERPDNSDAGANKRSRLSSRGFKEMGTATYRLQFTPADSLRDRRVLIDFEGIMLTGDVFLNGVKAGGTDYGYLGFETDVSKMLKHGEPNVLTVTASTGEPENSRWYTGGGLYRPVSLTVTDPDLYIARHGIAVATPTVTARHAVIAVTAEIASTGRDSAFTVDTEIIDDNGNTVALTTDTIAIDRRWLHREYPLTPVSLDNPRRWDCENPTLYTARVTVRRADGSVTDSTDTPFGIRTIEFSPDHGLLLNGKKVLLKGIANHHTLGALGAAAYPRAIEKRIELLKEFGFNHVRTSHNPYSEEFLNICDRHGMLVVDELYDKWLTQYAGGRREWTAQWQEDIPEWVKRDRNHPSVVMWSLGNELQLYPDIPFNDWGVTAYRLQKTLLNRYDTTRPVTVAMHPRRRDLATDSIPAPLALETDIAAYNYRYMYFPGDSRRYPGMIFYQSEASLGAMGPNFFEPDNERVVGLAYWGMIDYLGESLGWHAKGWTDGVFDISLNPKPNAWFLRSMFKPDEPVVRIGVADNSRRPVDWNGIAIGGETVTDDWNFTRGDTLRLYTYTNADEVELRLNGKSLGRRRNATENPKQRNRITWESVVYSPGRLEAIAYSDDKPIARHEIKTARKTARITATADNERWTADGIDLQHIAIEAIDRAGTRVPGENRQVTVEITEGDAEIVAMSTGDMLSDEPMVTTTRSLHRGRALAILRAGTTAGTVTVRVTAPGIAPVSLRLELEGRL